MTPASSDRKTLTESVEELERTDPTVAAAKESFDRAVDDTLYRIELHKFRPLLWDAYKEEKH